MSSSKITSITDEPMKVMITQLINLDLLNNSLKYIPRSITEISNTIELWIAGNPYECNCDLMWIGDWLVRATNVMDKENATCASGDMISNPGLVIILIFLLLLL